MDQHEHSFSTDSVWSPDDQSEPIVISDADADNEVFALQGKKPIYLFFRNFGHLGDQPCSVM